MTRPPLARVSAQHTVRRTCISRAGARRLALALLWLLAVPATAQVQAPPDPARWTLELEAEAARLEAALAQVPRAAEGSLRVRLAFGGEADLDLYVTDPLAETIYFANERAVAGGRLVADARCDSPSPRIEEVAFDAPLAGVYRVGVDYMVYREACGAQPAVVAYVLAIDTPRGRRVERGLARRGIFDPRRLELSEQTGDAPTEK